MEIGLFHMPLHPASRALSDVVKENTQKIIYADELGFAEAWVGEHMSATTEPITSPLVFLASLLPQTKNIKLCSGVVCLPNRHPAIVAAEVALFDHMAEGRFVFGVGPGGLASDMELFGNLDAGIRNERMAESMQMILKIWSQDPPYDIQGKHWQIKITENIIPELGVGFMQKPYTKPHPPIALTSMSPGSSSISFAVKKGYRPVSANFAPESTIISHWEKYVEGCEAIGREPTGEDWTIARNVLIGESDAQAEDWLMDPKGSNFYYFDYLFQVLKRADYISVIKPDPDMKDEDVTVEDIVRASVIFGSPKTVADKINSLRERSGPFGTLLMAAMDGSGENLERERLTMRSLAQEVLPMVNAS
ncbi:LLM class flavin-dependent oxidoreductase [Xinfangfangia sp. D13-10-4-6]|uniref:LLM class flavin-dependent oxidoreductase n=1 Tax=Pseudogemmobacter hezensis TaxID=2737662 RepID=UPI0015576376|nr:LLM class flavin-dependent oxidoreductase [Pseudogemmobacter hezensis]